jgi:hypothetical protein
MAATEHRFFSTMSVVAAVVIAVGFANVYPAKVFAGDPSIPGIVHLHAAVFMCWLLLFVAQTGLVMAGRIKLHQQVGTAGMALAGLMLVVGVMTAVSAARLGHRGLPGVMFPDADGFLLLNLAAVIVFSVLVGAGWYFRRRPQIHKRLMLMATVGGLMPPGIGRLPLVAGHTPAIGLLVVVFLLVGPAYDLVTRRRIHPAYLCALVVAVFGFPPVVGAIATLPAWHSIAARLIGG